MPVRKPLADQIRHGEKPQGYIVQDSDVGYLMDLGGSFGQVLRADVGKKIWVRKYGLVIENDDQRRSRELREMINKLADEVLPM